MQLCCRRDDPQKAKLAVCDFATDSKNPRFGEVCNARGDSAARQLIRSTLELDVVERGALLTIRDTLDADHVAGPQR